MPPRSRLPMLLLVLAAASACVLAPVAVPAPTATRCTPGATWGTDHPELATQVVSLINRYRTGKGLRPLGISASLTASSRWKSMHMADAGYFAHDDPAPVARSAFQRARDCGFDGNAWGENIAWGYTTPQAVVNGWLASPGHKANIESPSFTSTGVGAASAGGRIYWTQSFGAGSGDVTAAAAVPAIGGKPVRVGRPTGERLVASVTFVLLETGRPLTEGVVRCKAEVDGRRLRVLASVFQGTAARCAWQVPTWTKGKHLTGTVAVRVGDTAATRTFIRLLG